MPELACGTTIRVVEDDHYAGASGVVVDVYAGMLTGRWLAEVQLEGRPRWDTEGFYLEQIEEIAA